MLLLNTCILQQFAALRFVAVLNILMGQNMLSKVKSELSTKEMEEQKPSDKSAVLK